ncbi:hypothetical protein GJAV_G00266130 [Gymnothorax javanicus]|nr:hypothetical protein GJAV_G00266130 [Gymnothorax javanicus]
MFLLGWSIKRKHCDNYFDYWGKGTKVTVSSDESQLPSVFPLINCGAATDGYVILGCIAQDFTPDDVAFKWTHKGTTLTTEFLQYPSMQTNGKFMAITQAKVKASDWYNEDIYQCLAELQGIEKTAEVQIPMPEQPASLTLMIPSQEELKQNKNATFACLASEFSPKNYSFTWRRNGKILSKGITTHTAERTEGASRFYSATSFLRIAEILWAMGTNISCEFKHSAENKTKSVIYSLPACSGNIIQASIIPPSNEKFFLEGKVELKCVVTGHMANLISVEWQKEDRTALLSTKENVGRSEIQTLSIDYEEWVSRTLYRCNVKHYDLPDPIEVVYQRDNGNDQRRPSVFLMTPDDKANGEKLTLICAAKGFYPKEVLFSWNADDTRVDRTKFYTSQAVKMDQGYSAYSQLTVSAADWEKGIMYSCVVHHEAAPNMAKTLVRTIDSISKRSTIISFDTCLNTRHD